MNLPGIKPTVVSQRIWAPLLAALLLAGCIAPDPRSAPPSVPHTSAVAMPDAASAEVAAEMLRVGGNAVDAMVAAAFAVAVTYPEAGNIGGGGFMTLHIDGQPLFLDFRERAPRAATRDLYLDASGEVIPGQSLTGHRSVGVPGTVAGLWAAHFRHGRLTWKEVLAPAIALADEGFVAPPLLVERIAEEADRLRGQTTFESTFGAIQIGDRVRQPELAATLRRIASHGPDGFYRGRTAKLIVAEMQRGDGLISARDLAEYQPVWRRPLIERWRQYQVVTAPPPSSGGIALVQLLRMKDHLGADFSGLGHHTAQYVHLVAEMEKRVFADRAAYLGDPDFVTLPVSGLLDNDYLYRRAAGVDRHRISSLQASPPGLGRESRNTTHLSVVDRQGNAVALTTTLNENFGSGVVVRGAGFLLNGEMDDFSAKPGVANTYGVVGGAANAIAPGKRMLSSMTPTLLLEDGQVRGVLGTPGGSTIFTTVFQVLINLVDFDMSPQQALAAGRFHHQLLPPDLITHSPSRDLPAGTVAELTRRGYRIQPHDWEFGDVQLIWWQGDNFTAASDPRFRGEARVLAW